MSAVKQRVLFDIEASAMRRLGEEVASRVVPLMYDVDDQIPLDIRAADVDEAVQALSPADIEDILNDELAWKSLASDVKAIALRRDMVGDAADAIAATIRMIVRRAAHDQLKDAATSARYDLEAERFGLDNDGLAIAYTGRTAGAAL